MKYKTKIINDFVLLKKQAEKIQIKIDSLNVPQVYLVAVFENENFKFKQNENRRTKLG